MDVMEIGRIACVTYIILVELVGVNFSIRFLFGNKAVEARKRLQIGLLLVMVALLLGPLPFLLIGIYAIALYQTEKQTRKNHE